MPKRAVRRQDGEITQRFEPNLDIEVALPCAAYIFYFMQTPQVAESLNMRNVIVDLQKMVLFPD
jgi:hypothetical protein